MQTTSADRPLQVAPPLLRSHIPTLDGLRGLAILLVLLFHECIIRPVGLPDRIFARVFGFGWCGVDLFFVLSGFLITGILLDTKSADGYLRNFYARRILRIFPLYYGVLFFSLVLLPLMHHAKVANFGRIAGDEIWYWLYLSNFSIARAHAMRHGILDVSWSLAIEEQFYLVWPLLVLLLSRNALKRVCLATIAGALIFRLALWLAHFHPLTIYVATPARIDALAVGAWISISVREPAVGLGRLCLIAARGIVPLGIALLAIAGFNQAARSYEDPVTQVIGFTLVALMFGMVLVLVIAAKPGSLCHRAFSSKGMRTFGKYSYAMYLFHLPLRALVRDTILPADRFPQFLGSRIPGQLLFFLLSTAITFVAAWLSWQLYEKHFLRLKEYFEYGGTPTPVISQQSVEPTQG
jgi:peptidoglycan/LPS O-acetylase OafA/YrhL